MIHSVLRRLGRSPHLGSAQVLFLDLRSQLARPDPPGAGAAPGHQPLLGVAPTPGRTWDLSLPSLPALRGRLSPVAGPSCVFAEWLSLSLLRFFCFDVDYFLKTLY